MKLNNFEKCIVLFTVVLICIAGISQYRQRNNINNIILNNILQNQFGSHSKDFPANYKKIAKDNKIFEDLYDNDDIILTYDYENVPLEINMGKDFHKDFTKRLKKENLNFKIVTYNNYEKRKRDKIARGEQENCIMSTPETQEYDTFLIDTENCISNVCIIDNKNKRYTLINRKNMDYIISVLKNYNKQTN